MGLQTLGHNPSWIVPLIVPALGTIPALSPCWPCSVRAPLEDADPKDKGRKSRTPRPGGIGEGCGGRKPTKETDRKSREAEQQTAERDTVKMIGRRSRRNHDRGVAECPSMHSAQAVVGKPWGMSHHAQRTGLRGKAVRKYPVMRSTQGVMGKPQEMSQHA